MTNWSSRKRFENNPYPFHTKKKRKKFYCNSDYPAENKENFINFLNLKTNQKDKTSQYLYADPWFLKEATEKQTNRLKGGGVGLSEQQDIFYDCECEPEPQLQIFEIINEIKNPREFKSLLKQMAYTSNILYRTFRQAYSKTRKCNQNLRETSFKQMACGDMNPLEIVNIEIPHSKQKHLEVERYDSIKKVKREKNKSSRPRNYTEEQQQQQLGSVCPGCQDKENMCDICLNAKQPEIVLCCSQSSQKSEHIKEVNKIEEAHKGTIKQECDFTNWFPESSPCLVETNACQQYDKDLQHLDFCERCAVLRGEKPWPSNKPTDDEAKVCEKSSQTCQKVKCCKPETCASKPLRQVQQTAKQVLNLNPVCVTIPLKLQIDSQNCQSRFIETEIIMEASSGQQSKTQNVQQPIRTLVPICPSTSAPVYHQTPAITTNKLQQKNGSDLFYSCISNSGIIKPNETMPIGGESSLNEVLNIIKKRMPSAEEIPAPLSKTIGTRMSQPASVITTTMTEPKEPNSRVDFTQTEQVAASITPQLDAKLKAQKLRADLLGEVRAALEQTTPVAALRALMEGKRFSLPTSDMRPKESSNIKTPARHSMPSNYADLATTNAPLQPIKPLTAPIQKPALAPKPLQTTKPSSFVTETVQTDASAIKASGHYKRNEMRNEIQEELKELLEPNPLKAKTKYDPEERDEILLDLYKLFHPDSAGRLPKQISRENALQDISYLVKPESPLTDATSPKTSDSQESIIQSIKHILNPKSQQKSKKKKYDKETKEKILEDLQIILTPRQKKPEIKKEIRNSVLEDLRFMLDTGLESTSPHRPPRLSQLQTTTTADTGPSSSRAQDIKQQQKPQKPPNAIRDSLIADLRYLLDTTHPNQPIQSNTLEENVASTRPAVRKPPGVPAKPKKSNSIISSEVSVHDNDKGRDKHKVEPKVTTSGNKVTKSSSSDTFFFEMQDQYPRSSQQKNK
ncbi:uncharacterized protein LOC111688605 isoform X1 [Lucilia cuprina]|uniref:uncharacterized protein LOC111688605 isoform X1 n=2 Tax=Lucilia cuprina TaxID=7375 RepID=UPI001F052BAA|nr:uncharacterized protein LOC111688605 isoform X1 [Lucilia cuprina]